MTIREYISTIDRLPVVLNKGRFSFVIDLFSWAVPLNYDGYPGAYGWTHRLRILCFNFHIRTLNEPIHDYDDQIMGYGEIEDDIPF